MATKTAKILRLPWANHPEARKERWRQSPITLRPRRMSAKARELMKARQRKAK